MNNEEMKAKIAALTSVEEAYALAKECGFTGTMEEFKAQAAKVQNESMNLDAMDAVAGGGFLDYWRELAEYMWNPAEYRKKHQEPEEKINLRDVLNDA